MIDVALAEAALDEENSHPPSYAFRVEHSPERLSMLQLRQLLAFLGLLLAPRADIVLENVALTAALMGSGRSGQASISCRKSGSELISENKPETSS